jgi:hypothetical protein
VKATLTEENQRLIPNAGVAEQDLCNLLAFAEWRLEGCGYMEQRNRTQ